jgi:hypothetical protein
VGSAGGYRMRKSAKRKRSLKKDPKNKNERF